MSRVILLALSEADVRAHCARLAVGVSSIEDLLGAVSGWYARVAPAPTR